MKPIKEAYIVAATRSPIGKSGRGALRNTRPDDLLGYALKHVLTQVPTLDPAAIEDGVTYGGSDEGLSTVCDLLNNPVLSRPETISGETVQRCLGIMAYGGAVICQMPSIPRPSRVQ